MERVLYDKKEGLKECKELNFDKLLMVVTAVHLSAAMMPTVHGSNVEDGRWCCLNIVATGGRTRNCQIATPMSTELIGERI